MSKPFALGLGLSLGMTACMAAYQRTARLDTVEAKRIHIVDAKGNLRAEFGLGDEQSDPAILFYRKDGDRTAHLIAMEDHPTLVLFGKGDSAVVASISDSGPELEVRDKDGKTLGKLPANK